jgi:DNA polymerase-3 subunit epsilon
MPSMVDDAPSFAEVFEKFLGYLGTDILVGYHVRFDLHFLNVYMRQTHGFSVQNLVLDAQSMCRKVCFPPHLRSYAGRLKGLQDLDTVARHFRIEIQERHTALGDALATAMIFQRILIEIEKSGPGRLKNLLAIGRNV